MAKSTFIDGIASSQALDTSGEIVDLKGLDISSLVGAAINYEHKKDLPSQLVGKILEAKKIFGKEDCENPRHLYYWEKIHIPFLYIKARLLDDKKPSAVEVAAMFKDDAEHPEESDMLGFSVEGSKIEKQGAVITRSIARLVTLANLPANKTCIAEMTPEKPGKSDPNDVSELFKGEMQLFAFEPTYLQILEKKEIKMSSKERQIRAKVGLLGGTPGMGKTEEELSKDVGTGGGAFIGSQLAMSEKLKKDATVAPDKAPPPMPKPSSESSDSSSTVTASGISAGFSGAMGMGGLGFGKSEEESLQKSGWSKNPSIDSESVKYSHKQHGNVKISKTPIGNFEVHHNSKLIGVSPNVGHAGKHAGKFMSSFNKMEKSMSAGSGNAAPGQLVGGAALAPEDLDRKKMHKKEKSKWYQRADEAYKTWDKRETFREYMKKRMPHLAEGEVDAIGKCLALKKHVQAEGRLSKMFASHFTKGSDVMIASEKKKKE